MTCMKRDDENVENEPGLGMVVPVNLKPPSAWSGGEHSGERLLPEQRAQIRALWARGWSKLKIAKELKHSRNSIAAVIDEDGEIGAHLRETRATRMMIEEEDLRRQRAEVIEKKADAGKLSVADLNSAMMIAGIGIKDAGGAAPVRVKIDVEHEFHVAAELMAGTQQQSARPFMPPPVIEAEILPPQEAAE